ncbi:hypothetical protein EYZ11_004713 [Aspergillus tanneri]|uniref:Uncharacterized protein n=1 Tax=Aspergillus tanneri TaxID=1220188 RepID=A0A4S3JK09_9EURO|nr:hypothetical protein EYZ11_004713 [Aspergillus tanneri]
MYPKTTYIVNASGLQNVVHPAMYFDEIKHLIEQEASAQDFFHTVTYRRWTHIGEETGALCKTIAVDKVSVKVPSKEKDARIVFAHLGMDFHPEEELTS